MEESEYSARVYKYVCANGMRTELSGVVSKAQSSLHHIGMAHLNNTPDFPLREKKPREMCVQCTKENCKIGMRSMFPLVSKLPKTRLVRDTCNCKHLIKDITFQFYFLKGGGGDYTYERMGDPMELCSCDTHQWGCIPLKIPL